MQPYRWHSHKILIQKKDTINKNNFKNLETMSINYKVIQRENPQNNEEVKYYASLNSKGYYDLEDIANKIAQECTVTVHDVKAILSSLQQHIIEHAQNNESVRLKDLGSFHPRTNCVSVEDESELSTSNITKVRLHFTPSSKMHQIFNLATCKFNKISN